MKIVLIGNGGFAVRCLKLIREAYGFAVPLVVADPHAQVLHGVLEAYCAKNKISIVHAIDVNDQAILTLVRRANPDILLSAYNMQLLSRELLDVPRLWAVNFHNGPLPRYRGVNVYSWAIINGETEYGVSWHAMESGIDAGAILAEEAFPIAPGDTPTTLMSKGFDAGIASLDKLLTASREGVMEFRPQDERRVAYYSKRRLPNKGYIDLAWPFERIERFVRGLDFRPLPNTFVYPTLSYQGQKFHSLSVRLKERSGRFPLGHVAAVEDRSFHVQSRDGILALSDFLDSGREVVAATTLAASLRLKVGAVLDATPPAHDPIVD